MTRVAVFPGSFDPVTKGHMDIVLRALPLFDKVIVAIGHNSSKKSLFTQEQREGWLKRCFGSTQQVQVANYEGLTVDFCKQVGATHLLRGLRGVADFEFEKTIAQLNNSLAGIETVFLVAIPELSHINSNIVREILMHKGDASAFLPKAIAEEFKVRD